MCQDQMQVIVLCRTGTLCQVLAMAHMDGTWVHMDGTWVHMNGTWVQHGWHLGATWTEGQASLD